jgi:hypothetical protein
MNNREIRRSQVAFGALWVVSGMALVACSKGDTVNTGNTGAPVVSCGSLNATEAAELFTTRLDHIGTVALAAVSGLENSRSAARVLSFGEAAILDAFVSESQADLHDGLVDLKDDQLIAANVESSTESSVTFLLNPETMCEGTAVMVTPSLGTGGALGTGGTSSTIDPSCVVTRKSHPTRLRISRIGCGQGDNIAIEVLQDPTAVRVLMAEVYAERAEVELDLGAFLKVSYDTSYSSVRQSDGTYVESRTEKPLVSAATGVLHGTLNLTGTNQANGRVSVTQPIDFTTADESTERIRLAAGTDVATFTADGASKKIDINVKLGAFDANIGFESFIKSFFGLSVTSVAAGQAPVDLHFSGVQGSIKYDAATDSVTADGVRILDQKATATQSGRTLLSIAASGSDQAALGTVFSGNSDDSLNLSFANGLAVEVQYGLEPVMSLVDGPANYLAADKLTVLAPSGTSLTLWPDASSNDLAVVSSQTGELLRVNVGSFGMQSTVWPSDGFSLPANQCLARTVVSQSGHHELLDDCSAVTCSR